MHPVNISKHIKSAVADALHLFQGIQWQHGTGQPSPDSLPSLLEQCGELARSGQGDDPEPVRTVHHFSCTGGTLITKCLACVPNLHVLSEVDPLSTLASAGSKFAPGDLMRLTEFSNRAPSQEEKIKLFMSGFSTLHQSSSNKGLRLLVRDHVHSHFCTGPEVAKRPSLTDLLRQEYPLRSILTVRHPIDSYLSMLSNNWLHFQPANVDEYARRYDAFLDCYSDVPIFRYEDFVDKTDDSLKAMTSALSLDFPIGYAELFTVHDFSGDSGRKGSTIKPRQRRVMSKEIHSEVQRSRALHRLCKRLGYSV